MKSMGSLDPDFVGIALIVSPFSLMYWDGGLNSKILVLQDSLGLLQMCSHTWLRRFRSDESGREVAEE